MISPLLQVYKRYNIEFTSGKNSTLKSKNGHKYLDLGAGIAVNSLGYNNKKLIKTLIKAAKKPWHISNLYHIAGQTELAEKLTNNSSCDQVFFCNSGAEALETSLKIIRKYSEFIKKPHRKEIITFKDAFHGRTIGAISAAGSKKYQEGYAPLLPGFVNVDTENLTIKKLAQHVNKNTAAIFLEPIQGEGGIKQFSNKFLKEIEDLCHKKKIIFAVDEVQCGIGRTGKIFHHQFAGVKPDIIAIAKGIGGGFPLGACLVKKEIGSAMTYGSHGGTYGGNPLAMAVGNHVFSEISQKKFLDQVVRKGQYFKDQLIMLQKKHPALIDEVRGQGLMLGLKISKNYLKLVDILRENKVLTVPASNDVIRIIPPLVITDNEIKLALKIFDKSLSQFQDYV
jgi:acetylornithine/N-succinyldiaminopimelate aminotransferase